MDASVLVVGGDDFLAVLQKTIQDSTRCALAVAPNPTEAMPLIQAQQPDILVLQSTQAEAFELCQEIKAQNRLAWIYCILVNFFQTDSADSVDSAQDSPAFQQEQSLFALEQGADAYLTIHLSKPEGDRLPGWAEEFSLRLLVAQVKVGLRRVKTYRELMRTNDLLSAIALSDPLTELNNRRAFEWELPRQIQNARSRNVPISLIMLDVDYFKTINDTYGHLVGDRALQLLSARLRHNLRFYDTPFRYGGEEFVIILSDTGPQEASLIAHRICRLISEQPFIVDETLDLNITVSAGAASLQPTDDSRGTNLLHRADQNLLKAKSQGRNRVVAEEDETLN